MNPTQLADLLYENTNPLKLDKIANVLDSLKTRHDFQATMDAHLDKYGWNWYNKPFKSGKWEDIAFLERHLSHLHYAPPTSGMRGTMDF
jgi:hypothetical protein